MGFLILFYTVNLSNNLDLFLFYSPLVAFKTAFT
nr:MAG TPA: hypothetical protein [Caudoviricetes sp.]